MPRSSKAIRKTVTYRFIVVVDLVPSTAIFAQDGHRPSNHCIKTDTRPQALHTCGGLRHVSGGASAVIGKPQLTKPCVVISFLRLRRARPLFRS